MTGIVLPLRWPLVSVTGPTEEAPCVHVGLAAVAVVTTTAAMTQIERNRSSLTTDRLVITAGPCCRITPSPQ